MESSSEYTLYAALLAIPLRTFDSISDANIYWNRRWAEMIQKFLYSQNCEYCNIFQKPEVESLKFDNNRYVEQIGKWKLLKKSEQI